MSFGRAEGARFEEAFDLAEAKPFFVFVLVFWGLGFGVGFWGGIKAVIPTSVIQGHPLFIWGGGPFCCNCHFPQPWCQGTKKGKEWKIVEDSGR